MKSSLFFGTNSTMQGNAIYIVLQSLKFDKWILVIILALNNDAAGVLPSYETIEHKNYDI